MELVHENMTSAMPDTLETMPMQMEVEEHHRLFVEEPGEAEGLQLAIDSTFSVEEEDAGVIEIKQEPQDYVPEPEIPVEDELFEGGEEITDHNLAQVYPEINVSILQRAVSPPSMYNVCIRYSYRIFLFIFSLLTSHDYLT